MIPEGVGRMALSASSVSCQHVCESVQVRMKRAETGSCVFVTFSGLRPVGRPCGGGRLVLTLVSRDTNFFSYFS